MVKTFAVDANNDLFIGTDTNLAIYVDLPAVLQNCEHAVKAQLGEMVLNILLGMPNFQTIWGATPNVPQYEAALRSTLLGVAGVLEIISLNIVVANNELSYTAEILTQFGGGAINGTL